MSKEAAEALGENTMIGMFKLRIEIRKKQFEKEKK